MTRPWGNVAEINMVLMKIITLIITVNHVNLLKIPENAIKNIIDWMDLSNLPMDTVSKK